MVTLVMKKSKCLVPGMEIENIREDRKTAERFEAYLLSGRVLYYEGRYLLLHCIKDLQKKESMYFPKCSCGRGIPVTKIRIDYGGEAPLVLMLESRMKADQMFDRLSASSQDSRQNMEKGEWT